MLKVVPPAKTYHHPWVSILKSILYTDHTYLDYAIPVKTFK